MAVCCVLVFGVRRPSYVMLQIIMSGTLNAFEMLK
jgi:hypothetical protein